MLTGRGGLDPRIVSIPEDREVPQGRKPWRVGKDLASGLPALPRGRVKAKQ